ncbi:hypothetical protein PoB_005808200 [Plakobranchus ocellatus]|uniref:Uncharacterized protein n=1 Tax=Plakobranchus ocellatus TaxID=259542 RepID=A0AAV4CJK1_9GAST|nr:hypothetical protein PoB_005808200 [Plakobranchus ocellatus]
MNGTLTTLIVFYCSSESRLDFPKLQRRGELNVDRRSNPSPLTLLHFDSAPRRPRLQPNRQPIAVRRACLHAPLCAR